MLKRRRSDAHADLESARFDRLKHITTMLLDTIRTFSVGETPEETALIHRVIDGHISRLQKADTAEALEELERLIRTFMFGQKQSEQLRSAQRAEVLRDLNEIAANSIQSLAGESQAFATEVSQHLQTLQQHAMTDQPDQLRYRLGSELPLLYQMVNDKQGKEQQIVQSLQAQVDALERQLVKANEELVLDPLTQLYNRRAFDTRLQENIQDYREEGADFSLVLFDLDRFKRVNDTHGHLVGDRVLQVLARTARQVFRIDDFVARYGGEEFAVILYGAGVLYATRAAERFRLTIANKTFEYQRGEQMHSLRLTLSLGVASCHNNDTPESLNERADRAPYLAKESLPSQIKRVGGPQ